MDVAKLAPFEMATCMAANIIELKAMKAIEGKRVAVMGLGPAGLIGAQMLRAEGAAEVIGMDIDKGRREYAVSSGLVNRSIDPLGDDGKNLPLRRHVSENSLHFDACYVFRVTCFVARLPKQSVLSNFFAPRNTQHVSRFT